MSDIRMLMRSANPIPDADSEFGPDALDALRTLVDARSGTMDAKEITRQVEPERPKRSPMFVAAAAFAAVVIVVGAVWLVANGTTDDAPPVTSPPTTEPAPPTTNAAPPPETVPTTQPPEVTSTTSVEEDGGVLTDEFVLVPEGTWQVESLGTTFEIDVEGAWMLQTNKAGVTAFTHPGSNGPGDREVMFLRPLALTNPTDPATPGGDQWPVDDIEGWLDSIIDGVVASDPVSTQIGGVEGVMFEAEVASQDMCGTSAFVCVGFVENEQFVEKAFEYGDRYRVYWLDQGEHDPIAIVVGAPIPIFDDWAEIAELLLANVTFATG